MGRLRDSCGMLTGCQVNKDVLPLSRPAFQSAQAQGSNHHVRTASAFLNKNGRLTDRTSLIAEYAYVLRPGGILYTVTDVKGEHSLII